MTASASVVDLKPCPFCGGKDVVSEGFNVFSVRCRSCGASVAARETAENAEGNWNYRATPHPAEQDAREALEAEVAALTKALTGLTCGGSEFFIQRGDRFVADIPACVEWVRRSRVEAHRRTVEAIKARKAAEALTPAAPDGWVLVPVEPTPEMTHAGKMASAPASWHYLNIIYRAMLSASPAPPAQGAG